MNALRFLPYAGWPLAALLFFMWLNEREAVIEEREGCNVEHLQAALESEQAARAELVNVHNQEIQGLVEMLERERKATEIAEDAAEIAETRSERVRTVIKRVADEDACINTPVPDAITDSLRRD